MSVSNLNNSSWHGSLDLVFVRKLNETKLIHALMRSPLKLQRPFYPEGKSICHSVILHTAGGIVGGDLLSQNIHLQENSQALITTATAGKIYRSNGKKAEQNIEIKIDSGATLEWLPQETIVFNGAICQQNIRVELAPDGNWLSWEIVRFGRSARGEKFVRGEWRSHTEIWQGGKPLFLDRQKLSGSEETFSSWHGLAGNPIMGSLIYLGQPITAEIIAEIRNLSVVKEGLTGVSQTQNQGLICRYRGDSSTEAKNWLMAIWHLLRCKLLQRSMIKPRVWLL